MTSEPQVQPLPYKRRRHTFLGLVLLFVLVLPVLFFYAAGYRVEFGNWTNIVSTGGIYVAAERSGAEIYIDNELVRETRTFRTAFYAQSLEPGTHRVHVQKEGHHTWVKELPVYPHLVTEAQAFNLPLQPAFRVIAEYETSNGEMVVATTTGLLASSTNALYATSSLATTTYQLNTEYRNLFESFSTSSASNTPSGTNRIIEAFSPTLATTSTSTLSTTTKEWRGVTLHESDGDIYASWTGSRGDMPYYYCAEVFPPYEQATSSASTSDALLKVVTKGAEQVAVVAETDELVHPVQEVAEDAECEPQIMIDRQDQTVDSFDFFPGSTDFVVLGLENGIYVVEVDNRAWQNTQPLFLGTDLKMVVENGSVYVYDGELIYELLIE